jgi:flagellar basal-body rod protein FlgF
MDTPDALASASAGMQAQSRALDLIAENLANASTVGYRPKTTVADNFGGRMNAAASSSQQGALRRTNAPTDLALVGPGYFAVATRDGVVHTRDGRMTVDPAGFLCDARGNPVLGRLGPARFPVGASVDRDGNIVAGGKVVDRLRIVFPNSTWLERARASVRAGFLEESSVDAIAQMTALVGAERTYEANQKVVQRVDESLRRATSEVGVVRS